MNGGSWNSAASRRGLLLAGAAGLAGAGLAVPRPARAAWEPSRPLRLVVPFAAGGPADLFGRIFAEALGRELRQPVVVENRVGAGGLTGTDVVAKSTPDGHTLGFTGAGALAVAPAMPMAMPFDIERDLAHLTLVVRVPEVLAVHATAGPADLPALVAAAKRPGAQTLFGSAGVGSITHLAGALLAKEAGIEAIHVPYRGAAPAVTDLLAQRFTYIVADVPVLLPHLRAGALRGLAVTTARRVGALPEVPTTAELGLPGVTSDNWYGLAVAAGTSAAAQDRLAEAARAALGSAELQRDFARQEGIPSPMTREETMGFLRGEAAKWGPLVRATGAASM